MGVLVQQKEAEERWGPKQKPTQYKKENCAKNQAELKDEWRGMIYHIAGRPFGRPGETESGPKTA